MPLKDVKAVVYAREPKTSLGVAYMQKFDQLIQLCAEAPKHKVDMIVIAAPEVLGDSYAEVIESLRRIANAEIALTVIPENKMRA